MVLTENPVQTAQMVKREIPPDLVDPEVLVLTDTKEMQAVKETVVLKDDAGAMDCPLLKASLDLKELMEAMDDQDLPAIREKEDRMDLPDKTDLMEYPASRAALVDLDQMVSMVLMVCLDVKDDEVCLEATDGQERWDNEEREETQEDQVHPVERENLANPTWLPIMVRSLDQEISWLKKKNQNQYKKLNLVNQDPQGQ